MTTQVSWGYALQNNNKNSSNNDGKPEQLTVSELNTINELIEELRAAGCNVSQMIALTEAALRRYTSSQQRKILHYLYKHTDGYPRHIAEMVLGAFPKNFSR